MANVTTSFGWILLRWSWSRSERKLEVSTIVILIKQVLQVFCLLNNITMSEQSFLGIHIYQFIRTKSNEYLFPTWYLHFHSPFPLIDFWRHFINPYDNPVSCIPVLIVLFEKWQACATTLWAFWAMGIPLIVYNLCDEQTSGPQNNSFGRR